MDNSKPNDLSKENKILDYTTLNISVKELTAAKENRLAVDIKRILEYNQISTEEKSTSRYFRIDLPKEDIDKIVDLFFNLEASFVDENGEGTPTSSFYANLCDKWSALLY